MIIQLTHFKSGNKFHVNKMFLIWFTDNLCGGGSDLSLPGMALDQCFHVKETPEEIIRLLEGETDAPALVEGTFEWALAQCRAGLSVKRHQWSTSMNMHNIRDCITVESVLCCDWIITDDPLF